MTGTLLVVGSVAFDTIESRAGKATEILGGAATYISFAASHFSAVNLVAVVGKNDFSDDYINLLTQKGVNLDGLEMAEGRTFRWAGKYADDFSTRQTISTELGVFEHFDPKIPKTYQDAGVLLLGNINPQVQLKVLNSIKGNCFVVTDTMNLWIDISKEDLLKVISKTNLLVINDEESEILTGQKQISAAAQMILNMGPDFLIIKRGEHGAFLFADKTIFFVPAVPLHEVVDPTGAGDSFAGGLAGYLAGIKKSDIASIKKGMVYGTAVASFTCEAFGTDKTAAVTRDDVEKRYAMLRDMVSVD
jgi:sugar/nucleoside kinase (ribokinase family)